MQKPLQDDLREIQDDFNDLGMRKMAKIKAEKPKVDVKLRKRKSQFTTHRKTFKSFKK